MMRKLTEEEIEAVYAAAVAIGLPHSRETLLAGIDDQVRAGLHKAAAPGEQILSDLHALNKAGTLLDGTVPLVIWLGTAETLAGPRMEVAVFRLARDRMRETSDSPVSSWPAPSSRPRPPTSSPPLALLFKPSHTGQPPPSSGHGRVAVTERAGPHEDDSGAGAGRHSAAPETGSRFRAWWMAVLGGLCLIVVAVVIMTIRQSQSNDDGTVIAGTVVDGLQAVVALIALIVLITEWEPLPDDLDEWSKKLMRGFLFAWSGLWISWVVLYVAHLVRELLEHGRASENYRTKCPPGAACSVSFGDYDWLSARWRFWANVATNLLHNWQSTMFFVLFAVMYFDVQKRPEPWKKHGVLVLVVVALFTVGHMVFLMERSIQTKGALENDPYATVVDFVMALLTGLGAVMCMGMFVGRLESALLGIHFLELALLYGYAGSQLLFPLVRAYYLKHNHVHAATVIDMGLKLAACVLKVALFFIVRQRINSGRLAKYMRRQQVLCQLTSTEWQRLETDWQERLRAPGSAG
jgi:Effector-associated domain 5